MAKREQSSVVCCYLAGQDGCFKASWYSYLSHGAETVLSMTTLTLIKDISVEICFGSLKMVIFKGQLL